MMFRLLQKTDTIHQKFKKQTVRICIMNKATSGRKSKKQNPQ